MTKFLIASIVLMAVGAFLVVGTIKDMDFVYTSRNAQRLVDAIGRKATRDVLLVFGVFIFGYGVVFLTRFI